MFLEKFLLASAFLVCFGTETYANMLANPGFENGSDGWRPLKAAAQQFEVTGAEKHTGGYSLKIGNPFHYTIYYGQILKGIEGGATYRFSAWIKGGPAGLCIEFYDAKGKWMDSKSAVKWKVEQNWQEWQLEQKMPPETVSVLAWLICPGKGPAYFDDVNFKKVSDSASIQLSPARISVAAAQKQFPMQLILTRNPEAGLSELKICRDDTKEEWKLTFTAIPRDKRIDLNVRLPELLPGKYRLSGTMSNGERSESADIYVCNLEKPALLDARGSFIVDGKPYFPRGIYGHSFNSKELSLLKNQGFNTCYSAYDFTNRKLLADLFEETRQAGMRLMFYIRLKDMMKDEAYFQKLTETIRAYANHPALLCWQLEEEPPLKPEAVVNAIPRTYHIIKTIDKVHPIVITHNRFPKEFDFYKNLSDVIDIDSYPLSGARHQPLEQIAQDVSKAAMGRPAAWQGIAASLQSGWTPDLSTQPAPEQAHVMVYLALVSGAKSIFWYSFREANGYELTKTPLWPHLKKINDEIEKLTPILLLGDEVSISCQPSGIRFKALDYQGKIWLLAVNPYAEAAEIVLPLPDILSAKRWSIFRGNSLSFTQKDNTLKLKLSGLQTIILTGE